MPIAHRFWGLGLVLVGGVVGNNPVSHLELAKPYSSPLPPAPVTTDSLRWLAGDWRGAVSGGQLSADLMFSPPAAGTIVGLVRITNGSNLAVIELIALIDTPHGVELRFRHFGGDLTAYEPNFQQNMLLTAASDSDVTFTNQVAYAPALMSTQPRVPRFIRRGTDQFAGRSDIVGADGKPGVVESVYRRVP